MVGQQFKHDVIQSQLGCSDDMVFSVRTVYDQYDNLHL